MRCSGIVRADSEKVQPIARCAYPHRHAPYAGGSAIRHPQHLLRDAGAKLHCIRVSRSWLILDQIEPVTLIEQIGVVANSAEQDIVAGAAFKYVITALRLNDFSARGTNHRLGIVGTNCWIHQGQ